jgi:hypothetical protein
MYSDPGNADPCIEDPAEFFTMIFGGEAFIDWYASRHVVLVLFIYSALGVGMGF